MNRVFVSGDTHGGQACDLDKFKSKKWPLGKTLTKEDYVIIVGDFGLVWCGEDIAKESYEYKQEHRWRRWLSEKPWTTLFIDGNHENHHELAKLEEIPMFGDVVGKVTDSIYHLKRGRVYTINGKKFLAMGGAMSSDKGHRLKDVSWWEEEVPNYAEMDLCLANLEKHNNNIDYVLTHNCPNYVAQMFMSMHNARGLYNTKINDPTAHFLDHIRDITEFDQWFYGHWHHEWTWDKFRLVYQDIVELNMEEEC